MREVQVTKGQKFVSKYYPEKKLATVRGTEVLDGKTYVIYECTFKSSHANNTIKSIESIQKNVFLLEFKEKEDFFVVGGQYKSGDLTYYIQEIYRISNPLGVHYRKQARAIIINEAGKRWMEMLSGGDFPYVKRVK